MNLNVIVEAIGDVFYQTFELLEMLGQGWYDMSLVNLFWIFVGFGFFLYWTFKLGKFQKEEGVY